MHIPIDTTSGVPIYLQIINGVKYAIAMGSLKPGEQIPSVRELSSQLLINPNTVLKAIRELEHQQVIYIKRGKGAFVTNKGSSISKREREKIVKDMFNKAISQAINFKITPEHLSQLFRDELKKFIQSD